MDQHGPSRRAILIGSGLLAVAACSRDTEPQPPRPDPDAAIRTRAAGGVRGLVALYAAVSLAHPGLRPELAPLAAETAAHLAALEPLPGRPTASTSAAPSATASPPVAVPATAARARSSVIRAEQHEADLRVTQLASASAPLARLLAAIGASEATHATLLRAGS